MLMTIIWRYIVLFIFLSVKKKPFSFGRKAYDQFIFRFDFRLYTPLRSVAKDHENNNIQEM